MGLTEAETKQKDDLQKARVAAGKGEGTFSDSDRTTLSGLLVKEDEGKEDKAAPKAGGGTSAAAPTGKK